MSDDRLTRIEAKLDQLLRLVERRPSSAGGAAPAAGPVGPTFRRAADGTIQRWLGEGSDWEPWTRPIPQNAVKLWEKTPR